MTPLFERTEPVLPELSPFTADTRGPLEWTQPAKLRSEWRLGDGTRTYAVLHGRGAFTGGSRLFIAAGEWRVHYQPFKGFDLGPLDGESVVQFTPGWLLTGAVTVAGESGIELTRHGLLRPTWELRRTDHLSLIRVVPKARFLRAESTVEITDLGRRLPHPLALVTLCWFAMLHSRRHSQ